MGTSSSGKAQTNIANGGGIQKPCAKRRCNLSAKKELVELDLTLAIVAINGRNHLAIPFCTPAESYQPGQFG